MRRVGASLLGAVLAVAFCLATVRTVDALGGVARFPAYAGEDDFSARFAWFALIELPGFGVLGGWLGNVALRRIRAAFAGAAGMVLGTMVAFLAQAALARRLEALPDSRSANAAVLVFLLAWLLLAFGAAVLGVRRFAAASSIEEER